MGMQQRSGEHLWDQEARDLVEERMLMQDERGYRRFVEGGMIARAEAELGEGGGRQAGSTEGEDTRQDPVAEPPDWMAEALEDPGPDAVCEICQEPSPGRRVHDACMADLVGL